MPTRRANNRSSNAGNGKSTGRSSDDLIAAFRFFGTQNPQEASWEEIKKKYRQLSLIHHPDRNNGSEESKIKMQKINRHYELLKEVLEPCGNEEKGPNRPPKNPTTKASARQESSPRNDPNDPGEHGISHEERQRRRKLKKKNKDKARKEKQKERKEEERREEEQREAEEKAFQQQQEDMKEYNMRMVQKQKLDTADGRERAHQKWKAAKEAIENGGRSFYGKPCNPMMQFSNNDIAIFLLLGATEFALELVHETLQKSLKKSFTEIARYKKSNGLPAEELTEEDIENLHDLIYTKVLASPLDEDGNHALFYAVYHENDDMLKFLASAADTFESFSKYITSTNDRGSTILDFCVGSSNSTFKNLVQALYEAGQEEEEKEATV